LPPAKCSFFLPIKARPGMRIKRRERAVITRKIKRTNKKPAPPKGSQRFPKL
jgi:hypothetical protein